MARLAMKPRDCGSSPTTEWGFKFETEPSPCRKLTQARFLNVGSPHGRDATSRIHPHRLLEVRLEVLAKRNLSEEVST